MRISDWSSDVCSSDLPQCSSHGLRKAMAKRLAEAGCSVNEIMSITGHATEGEVIRYTKVAQKKELADHAMRPEERREGKERVRTCRSGWYQSHEKKNHVKKSEICNRQTNTESEYS